MQVQITAADFVCSSLVILKLTGADIDLLFFSIIKHRLFQLGQYHKSKKMKQKHFEVLYYKIGFFFDNLNYCYLYRNQYFL